MVKLPVISSRARAKRAAPATTARRNQGGSVPLATAGPSGATRGAGSTPGTGPSPCGVAVIAMPLLHVRSGNDQSGDHVHDQRDPEEDEPGCDERVDGDARRLR